MGVGRRLYPRSNRHSRKLMVKPYHTAIVEHRRLHSLQCVNTRDDRRTVTCQKIAPSSAFLSGYLLDPRFVNGYYAAPEPVVKLLHKSSFSRVASSAKKQYFVVHYAVFQVADEPGEIVVVFLIEAVLPVLETRPIAGVARVHISNRTSLVSKSEFRK